MLIDHLHVQQEAGVRFLLGARSLSSWQHGLQGFRKTLVWLCSVMGARLPVTEAAAGSKPVTVA